MDWHRHAVSSLAAGDRGWQQRANFIVAGVLYSSAALGLGRCSRQSVAPHIVPSLVAGVGVGLIGSGVFVTDPVSGFPRTRGKHGSGKSSPAEITLSREGKLHNICAIPIFAGIPVAGLASALVAARRREYHWACLSAGSSLAMVGSFLAVRRCLRSRITPCWKGRGIPADIGRIRVRMAHCPVAPCTLVATPLSKGLIQRKRVTEPAIGDTQKLRSNRALSGS